jgi:hypothetical protein
VTSFHEDFERPRTVETSSNRSFGFVFAGFFALIGFWPLVHEQPIRWWAVGLAGLFLILALVAPALLTPLNKAWAAFGLLLHKIVTPVIMGLLFFGAVTPMGWLMRAFGKRPISGGFDRSATSYWVIRTPPGPAPETMKQQF